MGTGKSKQKKYCTLLHCESEGMLDNYNYLDVKNQLDLLVLSYNAWKLLTEKFFFFCDSPEVKDYVKKVKAEEVQSGIFPA